MERKKVIAVIGRGWLASGAKEGVLAEKLGALLVEKGYVILTGGLQGVMEAVCRGARNSPHHWPGSTVGLLPEHVPAAANSYVDVPVATGLGLGRNTIVAHADALIAIGGGAGTLSEIALGWQLGRLIIGFRVPGWSGKLADQRVDDRIRHPDVVDDRIYGVSTAEEAMEVLEAHIERYILHRG